ncbi:MAG: glycosyltransferase family 2 protein [Planctomycetota bacterium]|jgi:glycosyltransferase involved in cell wall biosynthesis
MTPEKRPRVSIGLPVYNGEEFLGKAIESILAQTFQDFELIISDNASTDRTEEISRAYAAQDKRIRYLRNKKNLGVAVNFNQTFHLSSSEFFKWAAHDDLHEPDFLSKCIQALDRDPSVALAYTRAFTIYGEERGTKDWGAGEGLGSDVPHKRFEEALAPLEDPLPLPLLGVIRADILGKTRLLQRYPPSDLALLAELTLRGRFHEVPEVLFLQRNHEHRLGPQVGSNPHQTITLWDPLRAGKIVFPAWRMFYAYLSSVIRAPLDIYERVRCFVELAKWLRRNRQLLSGDLWIACEHLPVFGGALKKYTKVVWMKSLRRAAKDIKSLIPAESKIILVDEGSFGNALFPEEQTIPFLERDGQYWGCPPDDDTAIREFNRLQRSGAEFILFGWPAFWWLDHYVELHRYLRSKFPCRMKNKRVVVFDMRDKG